jgi:hypothetical protein
VIPRLGGIAIDEFKLYIATSKKGAAAIGGTTKPYSGKARFLKNS